MHGDIQVNRNSYSWFTSSTGAMQQLAAEMDVQSLSVPLRLGTYYTVDTEFTGHALPDLHDTVLQTRLPRSGFTRVVDHPETEVDEEPREQ